MRPETLLSLNKPLITPGEEISQLPSVCCFIFGYKTIPFPPCNLIGGGPDIFPADADISSGNFGPFGDLPCLGLLIRFDIFYLLSCPAFRWMKFRLPFVEDRRF